jgi:hypothetical protein
MKGESMKAINKKKFLIITGTVIIAIALIFGACAIYLADYYRADEGAIAVFSPEDNITVSSLKGGNVVFAPQDAKTGIIFYPGGKVEHNAYQPLMAALARKGVLCILVEMPFNLAVFDINAADGIREQYPEIEDWYIGGHSLGGLWQRPILQSTRKNMQDSFCSAHTLHLIYQIPHLTLYPYMAVRTRY